MAFQRSYSKVWWGSDNGNNLSNIYNSIPDSGRYFSLENNIKPYSGNLSRIQEVDDENSKLWRSHNSPGSLRSQDSGFSDNDDSHSSRNTSKASSPSTKSICSPSSSVKTIETPPTVIRRKMDFVSPIDVARRISFSAPNSPEPKRNIEEKECDDLLSKIDKISFVNSTMSDDSSNPSPCKCSNQKDKSIRRRRVVSRKSRRSLIDSSTDLSSEGISKLNAKEEYNNETVYFGCGSTTIEEEDNNNNSIKCGEDLQLTPLNDKCNKRFTASTSTPKTNKTLFQPKINLDLTQNGVTMPYYIEYENPLLNGHQDSVQHWIDDIRKSYDHEVMSTLQTKSIAQEAFRNLKITTNAITKIIRQLQQRSLTLQMNFERIEKIFKSQDSSRLQDGLVSSKELLTDVSEFTKVLERRSVFFSENRKDRKKFEDNIEHIKLIVKDTRFSLDKQHYIQLDPLDEDIQVLKRFILITLRLVFEKLVKVIVESVENSQCDLMLRANLNMIATLSNIDYDGFASLNEAFLNNEANRALLMVCLDNKYSSIRALALRALATTCTTSSAIEQFGETGGVEIIRDILAVNDPCSDKRTEPEKREAVSLLTQITAPWHNRNHRLSGFKECIETIVEGITDLIEKTECCQTLLLCAASLNNLSRVELTSVYSIMSNETIIKLKGAVECRGPGVSIFLYEQIVTMLQNMSTNKKCHSHLANPTIIKFITYIFQSQFYEEFQLRAESDAQRRTIKIILHIFTRLIHESSLGQDILEQNFIPIFSKVEQNLTMDKDSAYNRDIVRFAKQMNESLSNKSFNRFTKTNSSTISSKKFDLTRHESYV